MESKEMTKKRTWGGGGHWETHEDENMGRKEETDIIGKEESDRLRGWLKKR